MTHIADDAKAANPSSPARLVGARSTIAVPMLKDNELVGAIVIYRQEVRPFTDKQVALVTNFAAQAVIAIENTRLLNELRQRTDDLTESLQQQTATSQVLQVISSSTGELDPVFQAMLENATRICGAQLGNLILYETASSGMSRCMARHPPSRSCGGAIPSSGRDRAPCWIGSSRPRKPPTSLTSGPRMPMAPRKSSNSPEPVRWCSCPCSTKAS